MRDFQRTDDRVDAIVLDAVTPAENGASLARHAKDLRLPVVMISGPRRHELRRGGWAPAGPQAVSGGGALHRARQGPLQRGVRPAASLLTQPPTTLSAAVGQKGRRASSQTVRT